MIRGSNRTCADRNATARQGGWAPFNSSERGLGLLGTLDLSFLTSYALGMFYAGHIGDRTDLRLFLSGGMLLSGIFVVLFGMGFFWDIHSYAYFVGVQVLAGLFQSGGWPSVVTIVGKWCDHGKRGLVMGIWSSNTSVGNIAGAALAGMVLRHGWGWSFIWPGVVMILVAVAVYLFLVVEPADLNFKMETGERALEVHAKIRDDADRREEPQRDAVGFWRALLIPGVLAYSATLFFSKLVAYTFLYWLPFYVHHVPVGEFTLPCTGHGNATFLTLLIPAQWCCRWRVPV